MTYLINLFSFFSLLCICLLSFLVLLKTNKITQLQISVNNLKKNLDEMDEQAKLIVRTDIELNKTQEELDKKITGLYILQKLSRAISSTLQENQIFKKIDTVYLEAMGFEKALAFLWSDSNKIFQPYLNIGYLNEDFAKIKSFIDSNQNMYLDIIKNKKTVSSILSKEIRSKDKIKELFRVSSFVFSAILPKEGASGFLFIGSEKIDTIITEGDEELLTILANQLGQALENARLFEKTWQAHQELEIRVEERTRQLSFALEEVQKINKRKSDFVSSVSHELRTPLTSIKGYASILLAGKLGEVPEEVRRRLEKINKHSDELVQFVNDLLDISRIESGRSTLKPMPLALKTIVEEIADLLSVQLKEKQIEFILDFPKDIPEVLADYNQIKRVFINLINNAIKYTPHQGKITVRANKLDKEVEIDVVDTGCGIPQNALDKLFIEFYRLDTPINQEIKGTGLGLALVKNIIEAHKGKIWIKSKEGLGSTFTFTLPC